MSKINKIVFLILLVISIQEIIAFSNGITGYYGNTLGGSCRSCHGGTSGGSTSIFLNIPATGIVANGLYQGEIKAKNIGSKIFGLSLVAQDAPMNTCGQLIPFDTVQTQDIVGNLTHQKDGGLSNDSVLFKFWWKAPSTLNGNDVSFKWNVLCGDNDGTTSGDVVANGFQVFHENTNSSSILNKTSIKIYPNPVQSELIISGLNNQDKIFIYDSSGKLVYYQFVPFDDQVVVMMNQWKPGSYFLKTTQWGTSFIKK